MADAIEKHFYNEVSELSITLTPEERADVMGELRDSLVAFEEAALSCRNYRAEIYTIFNERLLEQDGATSGTTAAAHSKLARGRNSKIAGLNQALAEGVEASLRRAHNVDAEGTPGDAAEILINTQFNYEEFLLTDRLVDTLIAMVASEAPEWPLAAKALDAKDAIRVHQTTLQGSVERMTAHAAGTRKNGAPGDTLEYGDFLHEAYLSSAEAIRKFDPARYATDLEASSVFPTYIYRSLRNELSHFEVENSRIVKVPRTRVDRWRAVGEAQANHPGASIRALAAIATRILCDKRLESAGRKLPRGEEYTEKEVFELIQLTQPNVSLHEPESATGESDFDVEVGNLIVSDEPLPDETVDMEAISNSTLTMLRNNCTSDEQYGVLLIRYGLGGGGRDWESLTNAGEIYEQETGKRVPKSKVSEYEQDFFDRVRRNPKLAKELLEVFHGR